MESILIAQLSMYDWPELRPITDQLWRAIALACRHRKILAPPALDRSIKEEEAWLSPNLLLGQTCGLPYVLRLRNRVRLLGVMTYDVPGCEGGQYHSVLIIRSNSMRTDLADFRGACVAINAWDSYSGCLALYRQITGIANADNCLGRIILTGSHRASIRAVAEGVADLASIDCIAWGLALQHERAAKRVRVISKTDSRPGLPLITSHDRTDAECDSLQEALGEAVEKLNPAIRVALRLTGFIRKVETDYDSILEDHNQTMILPRVT